MPSEIRPGGSSLPVRGLVYVRVLSRVDSSVAIGPTDGLEYRSGHDGRW